MNREQLLDKLAMELEVWPETTYELDRSIEEFWGCDEYSGVSMMVREGEAPKINGWGITKDDYLHRRTELINKPSWVGVVGTQVEWLAQDANGNWFWFDTKPKILDESGEWICGDDGYDFAGPGEVPKGHDWTQTLERRPSTGTQYENTIGCPRCGGGYFPGVHDECPCQPDASTSDGSTASYYELPEGATELQDLISYRNLNAQDGEMFRALYRKGRASHSDALRDAKKVLFYAKAEVDRLERYGV